MEEFRCRKTDCSKTYLSANGLRRHMIVVHELKLSGEPATREQIDAVKRNQRWRTIHVVRDQQPVDPVNDEPTTAGDTEPTTVMNAGDEVPPANVEFVAAEYDDDEELSDNSDDEPTTESATVQQHIRAAVSQRPTGWVPGGKPRKPYWKEPRDVPGAELLAAIRDLPGESADNIATYLGRHLELSERQIRRVRRRLADMLASRQAAYLEISQCFVAGSSAEPILDAIRVAVDREGQRPARRPFDI